MDLPTLFALISAAILGLLPVLLLFGRRRMQRRTRSSERSPASAAEAPRSMARENTESGERPILGRLARDERHEEHSGESARERELQEAAIIAGASPGTTARRRSTERSGAGARTARSVTATAIGSTAPGRKASGAERTIDDRLARLTPMQRAIAYREILGRPAALREPGPPDRP